MRRLFFCCAFCLLTCYSQAQTIQITGEVQKPLTLSAADLAAMPRTSVSAKDKQGVAQTYSGVALPELFRAAGVTTGGQLRGKNLACWCPLDQPCHADVLLEVANGKP